MWSISYLFLFLRLELSRCMKQACPGHRDFLVSRAGIAPGVDSGDSDALSHLLSTWGTVPSPKCSCWSPLPHYPFPRATTFHPVPPLKTSHGVSVLFGAWLWVPRGPEILLSSAAEIPIQLSGAECDGTGICGWASTCKRWKWWDKPSFFCLPDFHHALSRSLPTGVITSSHISDLAWRSCAWNANVRADEERLCIGNFQHLSYGLACHSFLALQPWPPPLRQ